MIFKELNDIFDEALDDYSSVNLDWTGYQARMTLGVKIAKDDESGEVTIFHPKRGNDVYTELLEDEYQLFFDHGWTKAVYMITLDKYKKSINRHNKNVIQEMNTTKNEKNIQSSKLARTNLLKKYYKLTTKLNQLL